VRTKIFVSSLIMLLIVAVLLGPQGTGRVTAKDTKVEPRLQELPATVIEAPYTIIMDHANVFYENRLKIPAVDIKSAIEWTDVNGVSGFYIDKGNTHYTYIEGHIYGKQLAIYAPYYFTEEYSIEQVENKEDITK